MPSTMDRTLRTSRGRHRLLVGAATAALVLAACGSSSKGSSGTTAAAGATTTAASGASTSATAGTTATTAAAGKAARELVIARDMDINSLDPARSYCDTCQIFLTATYETLIGLDVNDPSKQVPRLATKWEANADNTLFTFTLDKNAKFADGTPVTSADVKWSWERLANVKGSASYMMDGLDAITAPDTTTVVVKFKASNSAFLPIVSASYLGITNSKAATDQAKAQNGPGADADTAEAFFQKGASLGSGPYEIESYAEGDKLVLKRNEKYWGTKPVFPKVTVKQVKDSSAQLQQLQQGDIDIAMQISFNSLGELKGSDKVASKIVDSYNYIYIALSPGATGAADMKDAKVREAMKLAIDYTGMIDATVSGNGKAQASPIPNGFQGAKDLAVPKQDLTKAAQLMKDAGKEAGFTLDAIYPKVNVYGVDFDVMMQKVQQDLKKIKVELKLQPVEFPQWSDTIKAQGIPVTAVYFAPDHTDSSQYVQYFGMTEGSSWAGRAGGGKAGAPIINPAEGDLLTKAQAASGDAKTKLYTQLGQAMMDDLVILPMVNPQLVLAYAGDVTNMHYSACCNLEVAQLGLK